MQSLQDSHHNTSVNHGKQASTMLPQIQNDQKKMEGPESQNYDKIMSSLHISQKDVL